MYLFKEKCIYSKRILKVINVHIIKGLEIKQNITSKINNRLNKWNSKWVAITEAVQSGCLNTLLEEIIIFHDDFWKSLETAPTTPFFNQTGTVYVLSQCFWTWLPLKHEGIPSQIKKNDINNSLWLSKILSCIVNNSSDLKKR